MALFSRNKAPIPAASGPIPEHIAIIMDGNGRWAKQRMMPRVYGHKKGVEALREVMEACVEQGVRHLTVFAFSSENWQRPVDEVSFLMDLFLKSLEGELEKLCQNNVRLRIVGNRSRFPAELVSTIERTEAATAANDGLSLNIAADYGGRWDIVQAVQSMLAAHPDFASGFSEEDLAPFLSLADLPEPSLFIRTGGECRISNYLLWQLAYTELYFTDLAWPDFGRAELAHAVAWFQGRERRFGRISEQLDS